MTQCSKCLNSVISILSVQIKLRAIIAARKDTCTKPKQQIAGKYGYGPEKGAKGYKGKGKGVNGPPVFGRGQMTLAKTC